jgi:succinate dehydrogenase/fumarate reductase cytochrome b subunit
MLLKGIVIGSIIHGLVAIIFVYLVGYLLTKISNIDVTGSAISAWNKDYLLEKTIFITGFTLHLVFHLFNLHRFYH